MPQNKVKSNRGTQRHTLSPGFPHTFTSLSLAIIGISGTLEPSNAVDLQGFFARTGPLVRRLDPDETALEAGHDIAREQPA